MQKTQKQTTRTTKTKSSKVGLTKEFDVRYSNIFAAKAVADAIRTSLGPKGMDKMIIKEDQEVMITNDGASILQQLDAVHPTAKMLIDLSKSQDIEAGDGTTSVVIIAGSLLNACLLLLKKGIHPTKISKAFKLACDFSQKVLEEMSISFKIQDKSQLIKSASTSLESKIISQHSDVLAPMAVEAVLKVLESESANNVDLNDIKIVKKLGGIIEDSQLIDGLVFSQPARKSAGGPTKIKNAKIGLIQFCISPPKTDMENSIVVADYLQVDKIVSEGRKYILNICKKIKKTGCNVLLIQKSILRDAVNDMSLHFLAKMGIMVVTDIERDEIEFISKTLNCRPIASVESMSKEKLGTADFVEEVHAGYGKIIKITGIPNKGKTVTALFRASNKLLLDEVDRSFHDALCVVRSLIKKKKMIAGGGAPEVELSVRLKKYCKTLDGANQICVRAFAEALEVIPTTLAENAGLKPIHIVTQLKQKHLENNKNAGINVNEGCISDMVKLEVVQPLLVTQSVINLATESVRMILKIDDII